MSYDALKYLRYLRYQLYSAAEFLHRQSSARDEDIEADQLATTRIHSSHPDGRPGEFWATKNSELRSQSLAKVLTLNL